MAALSSIATPKAAHAGSCAVAWGYDFDGQLGNGINYYTPSYNYNVNNPTPGTVTGLTSGVTAVAAGSSFGLALVNGGLVAWGYDGDGELGNGVDTNPAQPSYQDQTYNTPVAVVGMSSGVTAVASGGYHTLAIQNGALYAWGAGNSGQLGNPSGFAAGESDSPVLVSGMSTGVTAIAGGSGFSLAVQNGGVYAWGFNTGGLGNGTTFSSTPVALTGALSSGVTAIAAGTAHSLAIQNGGVYAWGSNSSGQLGNNSSSGSTTPVALTGILSSGVTAIAAGGYHSLAVQGGSVYAWGYNGSGQLGIGSTTSESTPQLVTGITGTITEVAASASDSWALSSDGSIWDWGANNYGQLGLGTTGASQTTPQHLLAPAGYAFTSIVSEESADSAVAIETPVLTWNDAGGSPADGTTWDIGTNQNWKTASASAVYQEGDIVKFTDANNSTTNSNAYSVSLNTTVHPYSVSIVTVKAYSITGTGGIADGAAGPTPLSITGGGSLTLGGTNTYTGGTTVGTGTDASKLVISSSSAFPAGTALTINTGAKVQLAAHTGGASNVTVTTIGTLTNNGQLDITNNDLILKGASLTTISNSIASAYAGGTWAGSGGITSSTAAGSTLNTVGVIQASAAGTLDGASYAAGDVLVKYTYYGDANLDGHVDGSDYSQIDNGFLQKLTGWYNGDFNYDGVINGSDYALIDNAFNTQGGSLGTSPAALVAFSTAQIAAPLTGGSVAVPEPTTLGLLCIGAAGLLGRRRRVWGK